MQRWTKSFAALALILGLASQTQAGVVYSNGPIDGTNNSYGISNSPFGGSEVTDSFTVSGATALSGAQHVGIWVSAGETPLTVDWSIGTTQFGSEISAGTSDLTSVAFAQLVL